MSKKKSPKHKSHKPNVQTGPGELARRAAVHFDNARYKDAIVDYRRLMELQPENDDWRERLLRSYRHRAEELANKGLYREAAAIWENYRDRSRRDLFQSQDLLQAYVRCLLESGRFDKIALLYREHEPAMAALPIHERAVDCLALQLLIGDKTCRDALGGPPSSGSGGSAIAKLPGYCEVALRALQAYCENNDSQLEEALKQIPRRSPYRDLAQLLKALRANEAEPGGDQVLETLRRIKVDSPFHPVAKGLIDCYGEPRTLAGTLAKQPPAIQALLSELAGLPGDTVKLLNRAKSTLGHNRPKAVFDFLLAHRHLLPKSRMQRICRAILVHYPDGFRFYTKHFGPLSEREWEWEWEWLEAKLGRVKDDTDYEYDALLDLSNLPAQPVSPMLMAAIYRRLAELARKLEYEYDKLPLHRAEALKTSLKYDDACKPVYSELIDIFKNHPKQRQEWIDKALTRFPGDRDFLGPAIEAAVGKGAFKKAATLAKNLLQADPLNQTARNSLAGAHLSHARKQMRARKYHLVEKELADAEAVDARDSRRGIIMLKALLACRRDGEGEAGQIVRRWAGQSDNPLLDSVVLHWESFSVGGSEPVKRLAEILTGGGLLMKSGRKPVASDLLACIRFLRRSLAQHKKAIVHAVDCHAKTLKKLGGQLKDHADYLLCCEFFYDIRAYGLLKAFSDSAAKIHKDEPLFSFYGIWATTRGECHRIRRKEGERLMRLMEESQQDGREHLRNLIDEYMRGGHPGSPFPGLPVPTGIIEQLGELMEMAGRLETASPAERRRIMASFPPVEREILQEMLDLMPGGSSPQMPLEF